MSLKKIVLVRYDRIGDVVLTLPMAEVLKQRGDCELIFLGRDYTRVLAEASPYIDGFISWDELKNNSPFAISKKLKKFNFDEVYIVSPGFKIALAFFLAGIKKRTGTGYRWYSFLFNNKVFEHRKTAQKNELEYNLSMLGWQGDYHFPPDFFAGIPKFKRFSPDKTKIITIIHPGSGGSAADLPLETFRELTSGLCKDGRFDVYLTGSREEIGKCQVVRGESSAKILAGELELDELISFIKEGDLFISNSTGPLHIAAAAGSFTVGFYPRVVQCSVERWGPYTDKKLIFKPEIGCSDCTLKQCARLECMKSINSDNILAAIDKKFVEIKNGNENETSNF
ncbi:MAG: glycosyltransferase family 9 protein [Ignavibacteriales bacterium]|nr:glycosyltransferase family 9 protein [Ignavibacteriales bacterium]